MTLVGIQVQMELGNELLMKYDEDETLIRRLFSKYQLEISSPHLEYNQPGVVSDIYQ